MMNFRIKVKNNTVYVKLMRFLFGKIGLFFNSASGHFDDIIEPKNAFCLSKTTNVELWVLCFLLGSKKASKREL